MLIEIKKEGDLIITSKDFHGFENASEVSHLIVELEIIRQQLIRLWDEWED